MKPLVAVAQSGGVDSSVAMHLLAESGYRVVGVSHLIWPEDSPVRARTVERAREVCRRLDASYYTIDMQRSFEEEVIHHFVREYRRGRTPNPCVRCNERMRFADFFHRTEAILRREGILSPEEDFRFATGHYARIEERGGVPTLRRAVDRTKDQTYMLYRVPPEVLGRVLFPLGGLRKREVVEMARNRGLPSASVRESQDVCFVDRSYAEELRKHVGNRMDRHGPLVDTAGNHLGTHRGYMHYTIGQRKGLGLGNGPWYVRRIEPETNRVVVCREHELGTQALRVDEAVWPTREPRERFSCTVQLRYQSREIPGVVEPLSGRSCRAVLETAAAVTPGQAAVFYDGEYVLGGGTIARELPEAVMAPV